jgi:dTDP-4-dehydrorhamnose 3,5-epimerase
MAKLVRCTRGSVFDVVVDLRAGSPAFGRWLGMELDDEAMREVFVPVGFGHAFVTLSDWADVEYKCSGFYTPAAERVLAWDDPDVAIGWPINDPLVSARDRKGLSLQAYAKEPAFRYRFP